LTESYVVSGSKKNYLRSANEGGHEITQIDTPVPPNAGKNTKRQATDNTDSHGFESLCEAFFCGHEITQKHTKEYRKAGHG